MVIDTAPVLPLNGTLPWYSPLPPDGVLDQVAVVFWPPIETIASAADPRVAVKKTLSCTTSAARYVCWLWPASLPVVPPVPQESFGESLYQ